MSASLDRQARDLADQMEANGAAFTFKPSEGALPASFNYALPKGGDRWKCRSFVASAKADPGLWRALLTEVRRRCDGSAE